MVLKKLLFGSFVVFAFFYGAAVGRYKIFPYRIMKETKHLVTAIASPSLIVTAYSQVSKEQTIRSIDTKYNGITTKQEIRGDNEDYSDVSKKQEIPCSTLGTRNTMVALTFGQSNSANYGETRYTPARAVYNFYEGKCYKAADPLLGATGDKGSVWTRLGDMLIDNGLYSHVIFVTIGVGGTSVSRWTTSGDLFQRIVKVKSQLDQQNLRLTHLLWHQGETDGKIGTEKDNYKMMLADMLDGIRHLGINAPLYLAITTRCEGPIKMEIHEAQLELVEERDDVVMGANTDTLSDMDDRYDFCHFSETGLQKHAALWLQSIQKGDSEKYTVDRQLQSGACPAGPRLPGQSRPTLCSFMDRSARRRRGYFLAHAHPWAARDHGKFKLEFYKIELRTQIPIMYGVLTYLGLPL